MQERNTVMSDEWYVKTVYSEERKLKERRKRVGIEYINRVISNGWWVIGRKQYIVSVIILNR